MHAWFTSMSCANSLDSQFCPNGYWLIRISVSQIEMDDWYTCWKCVQRKVNFRAPKKILLSFISWMKEKRRNHSQFSYAQRAHKNLAQSNTGRTTFSYLTLWQCAFIVLKCLCRVVYYFFYFFRWSSFTLSTQQLMI